MVNQAEISQKAKILHREKRKEILMSFKEVELHKHLKELFQAMEPDYTVEITHSPSELGKDLVIVKKDKLSIDVIGVIVKTGDIKAKTLGKIDEVKKQIKNTFSAASEKKIKEIESQVEQAFANPAEMKTVLKKLKICKGLLILAGELSILARTRLENEITQNVEKRDIDWLVDNFTDYYPQVFFEGRVIDFIQGKIQQLEKKHWLSEKQLNLSDYFVEPMVSSIELPVKFDKESLALIFKERKIPFSQLRSTIEQKKKIVLVGDPGVGKSGALSKLAIDMLKKASNQMFHGEIKKQKIKIPVLISAKEIMEIDKLESLLEMNLGTQDIKERFRVNVLMVDSLDEIPPNQGEKVIEKADKFSQDLDCSLIITSRKIDAIRTPPIGFEKYELLPFEFGQAIKVFEKLASSKQILVSLKDGLERIKFQIPMVPLSLMLLVELVEEKKEIPASVTELYDRFYDLMLGRWDKEKGIDVLFEYFRKRSFLAELAFIEFFRKEKLEITQEEFEGFYNNYANRYDLDRKDSEVFIKEIRRAGVLDIKETVQFRHRSFLDYFIARYIFDKRAEFKNLNDFIAKTYFNDIWGYVAFFYIGLMREISNEIIEKIFAFDGKELAIIVNKFLIGRLLQAGWNSTADIKYFGIEKAVMYGPLIRDKLLKIAEKSKTKIPRIYSDFFVLILSDFAFGSMFIFKQAKILFENLSKKPSRDNLYKMLFIIWDFQRFFTEEELTKIIEQFDDLLSKTPNLTAEDKIKSYLFLTIIKKKDKSFVKMMRRKLNKLKGKHQDTFKELLPHPKKGFRVKK